MKTPSNPTSRTSKGFLPSPRLMSLFVVVVVVVAVVVFCCWFFLFFFYCTCLNVVFKCYSFCHFYLESNDIVVAKISVYNVLLSPLPHFQT